MTPFPSAQVAVNLYRTEETARANVNALDVQLEVSAIHGRRQAQ